MSISAVLNKEESYDTLFWDDPETQVWYDLSTPVREEDNHMIVWDRFYRETD